MNHFEFNRWNLDRRFFYVWSSWHACGFGEDSVGPRLAVCDDFGNLVPTNW